MISFRFSLRLLSLYCILCGGILRLFCLEDFGHYISLNFVQHYVVYLVDFVHYIMIHLVYLFPEFVVS